MDTPAPKTVAPGTRIGPYEVLRELGRGSMGVVLAAKHVELGRDAALKLLSGKHVTDPESVERFRREAEACAALDHPGIVRLYERGEAEDGSPWFAMELVRGSSLEQVIRREPVTYMEAARIVAQAAHAMDFAHSQGILHRDLKPANILLDAAGRARITDFGLARLDHKATLTSDGIIVGTPLYAAPEVANGERASRRSDIYSLGATLYELATRKPPYEGRDARAVLLRVLKEPPIPPTDADPRIPRDLVRIIGKAMARDPDERYANARALALDLERFVEGRSLEIAGSTAAFRETSAARAWRRVAFHGSLAAGVLAVSVLLLWLNAERRALLEEKLRLARELEKARSGAGKTTDAPDLRLDQQGLHAAQDRDIRARIALRNLTGDAADANAARSVEALVARAHAEKDNPAMAADRLRQALQIFPHRWDLRLELAQALIGSEPDEAEAECDLLVVAPEATKDQKIEARALRARVYRGRGDAVSLWLAATDLRIVLSARAPGAEGRALLAADLAFALATTGDRKGAEALLPDTASANDDDVARAALARAAIARSQNDAGAVETELTRAREAAVTDDTKKLVEAFAR